MAKVTSGRHKGGVPPIVTIAVMLAFLIAAAVVGYFVIVTAQHSSRRCILEVEGVVYYDTDTDTIYFTLRNVGTAACDLGSLTIVLNGRTCSVSLSSLDPGKSTSVSCSSWSPSAPSVESGDTGALQTPGGTLTFTVTTP
ncbi:MAG: hypothetical protein DRK00_07250 [Thermoprotei archaeon]|nr:MAG: hypothetical protein DRK00_07250 [Thermoprotei archaeon]